MDIFEAIVPMMSYPKFKFLDALVASVVRDESDFATLGRLFAYESMRWVPYLPVVGKADDDALVLRAADAPVRTLKIAIVSQKLERGDALTVWGAIEEG